MTLDPQAADFLRLAADLIADQSKRIADLTAKLEATKAELNQAKCHQVRASICCPGNLPGIEPGKVLGAYPDLFKDYSSSNGEVGRFDGGR